VNNAGFGTMSLELEYTDRWRRRLSE